MRPLFVYGTLQDPEVFLMVTDQMLSHHLPQPALLENYSCHFVKNEKYPGLKVAKKQVTQGILVHGLNHRLLDLISEYETEEYELRDVNVKLADMTVMAQCYYPKESLILTDKLWKFEDWQMDHKMDYLTLLRNFLDTGHWQMPQEAHPTEKKRK